MRAIVLTGAGRAFCAGMDMDELEVLPPDDIRAQRWMRAYDMNRRADYQTRYTYFPAVQKPIVAAVNGAAAGLGLVMSLYCDVRFASESSVFATAFAKRGLIAEHGIAWILPRVVGPGHAADLLLSSRKVTAAEALRMGLVNRLSKPEALLERRTPMHRSGRERLAALHPRDEAAALGGAFPDPWRSRHAGQPGNVRQHRQRGLQGRRGALCREAARPLHGELSTRPRPAAAKPLAQGCQDEHTTRGESVPIDLRRRRLGRHLQVQAWIGNPIPLFPLPCSLPRSMARRTAGAGEREAWSTA